MSLAESVYTAAVHAARPLVHVAAPFSHKLRAGVQGRRGALERLLDWGQAARDPARPMVWLHAPSVGESLMA